MTRGYPYTFIKSTYQLSRTAKPGDAITIHDNRIPGYCGLNTEHGKTITDSDDFIIRYTYYVPPSTFLGAFEVEAILDHREEEDGVQYLIHWAGCDISESTWEPPRHVVPGALELVLEYHREKRDWFGNIEAVLDRKPSAREKPECAVPGARYKVQWEGWEDDKWNTWEDLDLKTYQDLIRNWLEGELGHPVEPEL
ncbi:hypothetical protein LTR40_003091 [Exophiala xenobiotica]|nr:hypothetical protein LTR40_003091 [Exophiala xenobiotica]